MRVSVMKVSFLDVNVWVIFLLSFVAQEFLMGEVNFEPNNRVSYIKGSVESNDTDSEYTQSSDDIDTVLEKSSSGS